jgi:hypothetical protein
MMIGRVGGGGGAGWAIWLILLAVVFEGPLVQARKGRGAHEGHDLGP